MLKFKLKYHWLAVPIALMIVGGTGKAFAIPDQIFLPYVDDIRSNLPLGWTMRLPSQVRLESSARIKSSDLIVKVFPSTTPSGLTVGLFTCETDPQPCLVGTFSVDEKDSANAQRDLQKHKAAATPIKLGKGLLGYLLEGPRQNPAYPFSSVMWEQDNMIYTVSFVARERQQELPNLYLDEQRQNVLYMAYYMANDQPLRSIPTVAKPIPPLPQNLK